LELEHVNMEFWPTGSPPVLEKIWDKLESIAWDVREMIIDEKKFDQMKYWITVLSKTGTKLEIQCLNPFWDSQLPHSKVSKQT
jgi:hypothetical protein